MIRPRKLWADPSAPHVEFRKQIWRRLLAEARWTVLARGDALFDAEYVCVNAHMYSRYVCVCMHMHMHIYAHTHIQGY